MDDEFPYDCSDVGSIVSYASNLEHHTLREALGADADFELADPHKTRGSFGLAMEKYYFGYQPNSKDEPDFPEAGLELKTTPLKTNAKGELVAKERLVVGMINYNKVVDEQFESSHFLQKARRVLLINYLYEKDKNPLDYRVESVGLWTLPEEDLPQIKLDWETVVNKVRSGHAEDISGSDTLYLEACTKAADSSVTRAQPFSDVPAKPRAWAFKASYMTAIHNRLAVKAQQIPRSDAEKSLGLLELLRRRFEPYFGLTEEELADRLGVSRSKNRCARITNKILKLDDDVEAEEFLKAGMVAKTLRLLKNGRPKESVSFPMFDYFDVAETPFEQSDFIGYLRQRYLFVLYREDEQGLFKLSDICLWQMPDSDFAEAQRCYDQMAENIRQGRADISVKSTQNRCCHVRPHGRNGQDTRDQPFGPPVVKKCFWLNAAYLKDEIEKALGKRPERA